VIYWIPLDGNLGRSQFTTGVITASIAALKVAMDIKKNALMRPSELAMFRLNDCGFPINVAGVEQVTLYKGCDVRDMEVPTVFRRPSVEELHFSHKG
jgi:hypothetical protein